MIFFSFYKHTFVVAHFNVFTISLSLSLSITNDDDDDDDESMYV